MAPNTVIIKTKTNPNTNPRITYPISQINIQNLLTNFLDKQNLEILKLTDALQQEQLTQSQWKEAQTTFQKVLDSLSDCVEQTCMTQPTPPLPHRAKIQGGFLPRTQQKIWKSHLKLHHNTRKAIHAACHYHHTQLHNYPDILALLSLHNVNIPPSLQTSIATNNGSRTLPIQVKRPKLMPIKSPLTKSRSTVKLSSRNIEPYLTPNLKLSTKRSSNHQPKAR